MSVYWWDTDYIGPKFISCELEQEKGIQLSWRQSLLCTSFIKKEKEKKEPFSQDIRIPRERLILHCLIRRILDFYRKKDQPEPFGGKGRRYSVTGMAPTHTIGIIGEQGELESLLCSLHSIICPFKNIEPPSVHQTLCLDPGRFTNIPLRGRASAVVARSKQKTENYLQGVGRVYLISYKLGIKSFHVTVAVYKT